MDRAKGVLKGGWHPSGDREIHRKTWKTDLKGIATGKKDDGSERAQNHSSTPLSALKDPDSFGPPPKHSAYYPNAQSPSALTSTGSASSPVARSPATSVASRNKAAEATKPQVPKGPYRVDTTGLRTDNLPKPPLRRDTNSPSTNASSRPVPNPVTTTASSRPVPNLPQRKTTGPPPVLPPRQTENPHEYTPDAPPSYGEATTQSTNTNSAAIDRLGRAGVNVPGFGIGNSAQQAAQAPQTQAVQGHSGQLSELQQRFNRMNTGAGSTTNSQSQPPSWKKPSSTNSIAESFTNGEAPFSSSSTSKKKPPPPPPAKKDNLVGQSTQGQSGPPPPVPMASKPRPG